MTTPEEYAEWQREAGLVKVLWYDEDTTDDEGLAHRRAVDARMDEAEGDGYR